MKCWSLDYHTKDDTIRQTHLRPFPSLTIDSSFSSPRSRYSSIWKTRVLLPECTHGTHPHICALYPFCLALYLEPVKSFFGISVPRPWWPRGGRQDVAFLLNCHGRRGSSVGRWVRSPGFGQNLINASRNTMIDLFYLTGNIFVGKSVLKKLLLLLCQGLSFFCFTASLDILSSQYSWCTLDISSYCVHM